MAAEKTAPEARPGAEQQEGGRDWGGILMDVAGLLAGVVVTFVILDILTDGRLSRPFRKAAGSITEEAEGAADSGD